MAKQRVLRSPFLQSLVKGELMHNKTQPTRPSHIKQSAIALGIAGAAALFTLASSAPLWAAQTQLEAPKSGLWIVELELPSMMQTLNNQGQSMAQSDRSAPSFKQQLALVEDQVEQQRELLAQSMAMELTPRHSYRVGMTGFAAAMSAADAELLRQQPGVKAVYPDVEYVPLLDSGPAWIGAPGIWNGPAGSNSEGEGVVVGVIDGGINWDHPFFSATGADGFTHTNPRGQTFGLCSNPAVVCNNKLIGVYDFTNEGSNGRSITNHGSHVASIAAGNRLALSLPLPSGNTTFTLSGVAPHANVISYKVCESTSNNTAGSCSGAAILNAIEQAVLDRVDVINISLGTTAPLFELPWRLPIPNAELSAREAGVVVAVAAGNLGPQERTVSSSGHSPWVITAGNSTHNRIIGQTVTDLSGGATTPPPDLVGAGNTEGSSERRIVHARDFGFALCGVGPAELRSGCNGGNDAITGASNPFAPNTFNGEIVVCDRGEYGRVEKGFNVLAAGAGGMILANTEEQGRDTTSDAHCLPAVHVDSEQGDALRTWLASGDGHRGRITATNRVLDDGLADQIVSSSSRGPNPEIPGVVKPNLMAPGANILGASADANAVAFLTGTSMASPHVAGSAALLLGVNPGWTPAHVQSTLVSTARHNVIFDGDEAAPINSRGAGLAQPTNALNAGLYLNISANDFRAANPANNGDPRQLNLALMQDPNCMERCSFTRRVTDLQGGGSWQVAVEGELPLTVAPSQFTLSAGQSQVLTITADVTDPSLLGRWVDGAVVLRSPGAPEQRLQATVLASGGALPTSGEITTTETRGRVAVELSGLAEITLGNWDAGNLVPGVLSQFSNISQDPSRTDPFDSPAGTALQFIDVPADTAFLLVRVNQASASDIDLFVGLDSNGNRAPSGGEQLCSSTTSGVVEQCMLLNPEPGTYWAVYQNFSSGTNSTSSISTEYAVAAKQNSGNFFVNGPGVVAAGDNFSLDLAWDDGRIQNNSSWWGALTLGTDNNNPGNIGILPIRILRSGRDTNRSLPLFNQQARSVAVAANDEYDRMFIDVPPGAQSLTVTLSEAGLTARGALDLAPVAFDNAFAEEPFAAVAPAERLMSRNISNGGVTLNVAGASLIPGRWYVIPRNTGGSEFNVRVEANVVMGDAGFVPERNSFGPINRNISQGVEFNRVGNSFGAAFFTYEENGAPVTYLGAGSLANGQSLLPHGPLNAFVGIPGAQEGMPVGYIGLTFIGPQEAILSYDLLGESGSERLGTIAQLSCPQRNGQLLNVTGHWTPQTAGGGGTALLVNENNQAYVFYFFDQQGRQRWLLANSPDNFTTNAEATARQFRGYCPTCAPTSTGQDIVGTVTHSFINDVEGQQVVNVNLAQPLNGSVQLNRALFKLTDPNVCQ